MGKMLLEFEGYGREFCKATMGHDKTWPSWANDDCPGCGREFRLSDYIVVIESIVWHKACAESNGIIYEKPID